MSGQYLGSSLRIFNELSDSESSGFISTNIRNTIRNLQRTKDYISAMEFVNGCLEKYPNNLELEFHRINILIDLDKLPDALDSINAIIKHNHHITYFI